MAVMDERSYRALLDAQDWGDIHARLLDFAEHRCGKKSKAQAKDLTEAALNQVRKHLKKAYGFDLTQQIPAPQMLHYLSGMIHYAKLRWALLAEYDI